MAICTHLREAEGRDGPELERNVGTAGRPWASRNERPFIYGESVGQHQVIDLYGSDPPSQFLSERRLDAHIAAFHDAEGRAAGVGRLPPVTTRN